MKNTIVQRASPVFIIIGLIWWFIYQIIEYGVDIYLENDRHFERQKKEVDITWFVIWHIILFVGFLIGLLIVFS